MGTGPGTIRPSQVITTFGPGAIYDNLKDSMLILGTDSWRTENCKTLRDETLLLYLKKNDNRRYANLTKFLVPISKDDDGRHIPVKTFPRWGVCPVCHRLQRRNRASGDQGVSCISTRCPGRSSQSWRGAPQTIPVRFIAACKNGHLEDFPWYRWVHRGTIHDCSEDQAELFLIDNQEHSSLESKIVRCENCTRSENMGPALSPNGLKFIIPEGCHGKRPWLTTDEPDSCVDSQGNRVYLRGLYKGSSNVYFSKTIRAVTVPPFAGPLAERVISMIDSTDLMNQPKDELKKFIPVLFPHDDPEEVISLIGSVAEKRRSEIIPDIRTDEFRELNSRKFPQKGVDKGDFRTEPIELPENFSDYLDNLVLVRRMREVVALTGFFRIESFGADENDIRRPSPITNYPAELPTWLPAVENRGEGIFFSLKEKKIDQWINNMGYVEQRFREIVHDKNQPILNDDVCPTIKYVLLHTLSHLLIKEISNFAGYSTSSIRERIYAREKMSGVMLYTSSPSSDGSLGGLVEQGKKPKFNIMLQKSLRKAAVCSMDPLCSFVKPGSGNRRNGSACHACLFLPETSCECMNDLLDRSFVTSTLSSEMGFFGN